MAEAIRSRPNSMLNVSPETGNPKTRKTLSLIRQALEGGPAAGIAQIARLIQELTSKLDTLSVQNLGDLIGGDVDLMARVLTAANTLGYNASGTPVTTIHQAIHLVGFEKIRNLAVALLLLDTAEKSGGKRQQKAAAAAFGSALVAKAVVGLQQRGDPEEAFVCAALRNYGELLLSHCLPQEFDQAEQLSKTTNELAAFREVFGLTPLEVGYEILSESSLPKSLLAALKSVPRAVAASKSPSLNERLAIAAEFSTRLCQRLENLNGQTTVVEEAQRLAREYPHVVKVDEDQWDDLFKSVSEQVRSFASAQGLKMLSAPLIQRLKAGGKSKSEEIPVILSDTRLRAVPNQAAGSAGAANSPLGTVLALLSVGKDGRTPSLDEGLHRVLEWLNHELKLSESAVFLRDPVLPTWSARMGSGPLFEQIRDQPLLSPDSKNVFTICLTRGEDVLIENPSDSSIRRYLPEWLQPHVKNRSLLLLSLKSGNDTLAVICGVGEARNSISLTTQLAQPLQQVRSQLAQLRRAA